MQQVVGGQSGIVRRCESDAHSNHQGSAGGDVDRFGESGANRFDGLSSLVRGRVFTEDHEFVAAEPGDDVASLAGDRIEAEGDLDQDTVADGVSVLVVDGFEAVQVEEDHGAGFAAAVMAGDGDLDPREDLGPVGEAGQAVMECLMDEHGLLMFALDRVGDRPDDVVRVNPALDEIVLRTFTDGEEGKGFVLLAAEHHDRHSWVGRAHSLDRLEAVGVR